MREIGLSPAMGQAKDLANDYEINQTLNHSNSKNTDPKKIKELSKEFEALFLDFVLKSMRQTVGKSDFLNGGHAEELYQGMLDSEYSRLIAGKGMTGLSDMIEHQLLEASGNGKDISKTINEARGKKLYSDPGLIEDVKRTRIDSGR